jgi:hypothetical protein
MTSVSDWGADLRKSRLGIAVVHADSVKPNAMTPTIRLMTINLGGLGPPLPRTCHRVAGDPT